MKPLVALLSGLLLLGATLPQTPSELPSEDLPVLDTGDLMERYEYDMEVDPLTGHTTKTLNIGLSSEILDRGFFDPASLFELFVIVYTTTPDSVTTLEATFITSVQEPLGSLSTPKYSFIYRPLGHDAIQLEAAGEVGIEGLGVYSETVSIELTPRQSVELLTSPLVRLQGDERYTDYEFTDTDKQAILWFLENHVWDGNKVIHQVRTRLQEAAKKKSE